MKSEGKQAGKPVLMREHFSASLRIGDMVYISEDKGEMGTHTAQIKNMEVKLQR